MLWSLAGLAPLSLLVSDLPRAWAWPLAGIATVFAVRDAYRHARLPSRALVIPVGRGQATCDGQPMRDLQVGWRGPLAFLRWRDPSGRLHRLAFWPDTLAPTARRELRLAAMRMQPAREAPSVAG